MGGELSGARALDIPDQDARLRLGRHGNRLAASVSTDGVRWRPLDSLEVELPTKVRIGVTAVNTARQPLTVRFEELRVGH